MIYHASALLLSMLSITLSAERLLTLQVEVSGEDTHEILASPQIKIREEISEPEIPLTGQETELLTVHVVPIDDTCLHFHVLYDSDEPVAIGTLTTAYPFFEDSGDEREVMIIRALLGKEVDEHQNS